MVSICVFGSRARRTADALSDRDLLVIGESEAQVEQLSTAWQVSGWNVTRFSHRSFKRMVEMKALFIQHLKQEGCVIRDDGNFLASVLSGFSPKADYEAEKRDAIEHLVQLPPINRDYWLSLCVGDIMYVLFRNMAVLHLASRRTYVFAYDRLVSAMCNEFRVAPFEHEALFKLREIKHAYRKRRFNTSIMSSLPIARDATRAIAGQMKEVGSSSIADGHTNDAYFRLRQAELNLLRKYDPRWLDSLQPHDRKFGEWQLIRNSGGYPKPRGILKRCADAAIDWSAGSMSVPADPPFETQAAT